MSETITLNGPAPSISEALVDTPVNIEGLHQFVPPVLYQWPEFARTPEHKLATLFIDVAGFTSLSEALATLGPEGAEILERTIARYFDALMERIEAYHGMPIKVSGDALTVVFPDHEGNLERCVLRALMCASSLRTSALAVARVEIPAHSEAFPPVVLAHKIGVGVGRLLGGTVGDAALRLEYVFSGEALDRAVAAEHHAKGGQVWACPEVLTMLGETHSHLWVDRSHGYARLHDDSAPEQQFPPSAFAMPPLGALPDDETFRRRYLPLIAPAVREHAAQGTLDYLCRHQVITVMFVGCPELKCESPAALVQLDAHYRRMQQIIEQFGGFLSEFEAGDKGAKLIVLFGAPTVLEDPCGQAARCAQAMQDAAREMDIVKDQRIGMTSGRLYVGRIGCRSIVKYSALGDRMNLAARLMGKASQWMVLAERQAAERSQRHARWGTLRKVTVKGKEEPIEVAALQRSRKVNMRERRGRGIIGRKMEQHSIQRMIEGIKNGKGALVLLDGPAGVGKTRLLEFVRRIAREQGEMKCLTWNGAPVLNATPFSGWQGFLMSLVGMRPTDSPQEKLRTFRAWRSKLAPDLQRRVSLLGSLLGVAVEVDSVYAGLPADQLYLFRQRLLAEVIQLITQDVPHILIMDSAERLDLASTQVLVELGGLLEPLKLMLVVAYRPPATGQLDRFLPLNALPAAHRLTLKVLSEKDSHQLVAKRLKVKQVDPELLGLLLTKTAGNPLLLESWVDLLRDQSHIRVLNDVAYLQGSRRVNALPDKLEALVLTQLERLSLEAQLSVLVAGVIGLPFTSADVAAIHPEDATEAQISEHLRLANQAEILWYDRERPNHMIFRSPEVRAAIHDSMPFSLRRTLHARRAETLTARLAHSPSIELELLLAAHYEYVDSPEQQRAAFFRAMRICRDGFDHQGCVRWGRRVLEACHKQGTREGQLETYQAVSSALSKMGETDERQQMLNQWVEEARASGDRRSVIAALVQRSINLLRTGQAGSAQADLACALEAAREIQDGLLEAEVKVNMAMVDGENGHGDKAILNIDEALRVYPGGNPDLLMRILSNRGFALSSANRPAEAHAAFQDALSLSEQCGNIWAQAVLEGNLAVELWNMGYPQQAHTSMLKALELKRTVGDRREVGLTLSNVGFSFYRLGELAKARSYMEEACQLFRRLSYARGEIFAHSNLGEVVWLMGDTQAARKHYETVQERLDRAPHAGLQTELWVRQGELMLTLGDLKKALEFFQSAFKQANTPARKAYRCNAREGMAMVHYALGALEAAQFEIEDALKILEEGCEGLSFPQRVWWRASQIYEALDIPVEAERCARRGLDLVEKEQSQLQGQAARQRQARAWPWNRELMAWQRVRDVKRARAKARRGDNFGENESMGGEHRGADQTTPELVE